MASGGHQWALNGPLVEAFVTETMVPETAVMRRLREHTSGIVMGHMQVSADEGALLAFLVRLIGARRVLEVGTFTGYSSLAMIGAMPADGRILTCDTSPEWTAVAERAWAEAGVADRITLRLAPAQETLSALIKEGEAGTYDFAFIDADKAGTPRYYELCLTLVRQGGLVLIDNALSQGNAADPDTTNPSARAMREACLAIRDDERVDRVLLNFRDGVLLTRKR
jgi:predicted O-methyltransferase YrrM